MKTIYLILRIIVMLILFLVGFVPVAEYFVVKSIDSQSFFSIWTLAAIGWLILSTEINIYIILFLQRTPLWETMTSWLRSLIPWNQKIKVPDTNGKTERFKKYLSSLGYFGLFICTAVTNLGRIGDTIFATNRTKLPYGRIYLYAGCIMRVIITYGGFSLLWS